MKTLLLIVFAGLFIHTAAAQEKKDEYIAKPRLSVGAEFSVPSNRGFGERFSIGFGGSAKFEVPVTKKFYGTVSAGFIEFFLKEKYKSMTFNKTYVPLKAGAKYYMDKRFYTEAEIGASIGTNNGAGTALAWAAGAGLSFPITEDGYFDTGIRYEKWDRAGGNIGQAAFRIAYKF